MAISVTKDKIWLPQKMEFNRESILQLGWETSSWDMK